MSQNNRWFHVVGRNGRRWWTIQASSAMKAAKRAAADDPDGGPFVVYKMEAKELDLQSDMPLVHYDPSTTPKRR